MKRLIFILTCIGVNILWAKAPESVWSHARASSDLLVYFDTVQAEKGMTRQLWQTIEAGKKRAKQRNKESNDHDDFNIFNTEDRDIRGVLNFRIVTGNPLRMACAGTLATAGGKNASVSNDCEALFSFLKPIGAKLNKTGTKKEPQWNLSVPATNGFGKIKMEMCPKNNNFLDFVAKYNMVGDPPPRESTKDALLAGKISAFRGEDWSFVLMGVGKKIAKLPMFGNTVRGMKVKHFLLSVSTLSIAVRIKGESLIVCASFSFIKENEAQKISDDLKGIEDALAKVAPEKTYLKSLRIRGEGNDVYADCELNLKESWAVLEALDQEKTFNAEKKGENHE